MTIVAKSTAPGPFTPPGVSQSTAALAAPTHVGVWPGEQQASVYWRDGSTGDATGFKVYRSNTSGFTPSTGNRIVTTGTTDNPHNGIAGYLNTGLTNGSTYYYRVKATSSTGDSAATSEISVSPSSGGSPSTSIGGSTREPAGYTKIFSWDEGHEFPPFDTANETGCDTVEGVVGSAKMDSGTDTVKESFLVHTTEAPVGSDMVIEQRWPAGKSGESLHEKYQAWATPSTSDPCDIRNQNPDPDNHYRSVYIREWRKTWTDSTDGTFETFETGNGNKWFYVRGDITGSRPEGSNVLLGGSFDVSQAFISEYDVKARVVWGDNNGDTQSVTYGASTSAPKIQAGQWHETEWLITQNTVGATGDANADGVIKCWIDGTLAINETGVKMRSGFNTKTDSPLQAYNQPITWSGNPDVTHTHNKGFLVSYVYASGTTSI